MYEVVVTDAPDPASCKVIVDGITAFNTAKAGASNVRPLAAFVKGTTGQIVGGLIGWTSYKWLYIEILWIAEELRKTGIGTRVLRNVEEEAVARGCIGSWLYTASFQARGFYEKAGYSVLGTIADLPPGQEMFFMDKRLL